MEKLQIRKLEQNMLKNMSSNKLIYMFGSFLCLLIMGSACQNHQGHEKSQTMSQSLSLIKQKPDSQKNILSDSSLQNGNIKIKFDSTTEKVQLMYKGQNGEKNIELGRLDRKSTRLN